MLDARKTNLKVDRTTACVLLVTVVVVVSLIAGAVVLEESISKNARSLLGSLFCITSSAGLIALLVSFATDARRYLKREITPRLVRALAPLRPKPDEILDAVGYARSLDLRIGKRVNPSKLFELIQKQLPRQPSLN